MSGKTTMNGTSKTDRLFYLHSDFKIGIFLLLVGISKAPKERFSFCCHDDFFLGSTVVFLSLFCAMELFFSNLIVIVL